MKTCPVSVIIPYYNSENTIVRSVASVLDQTRPPAQIICVNDASTDRSLERLEKFLEGHPAKDTVTLINLPENSGVYVARNIGLKNATEPYLAFQDGDDFWHPQKLEIQYAFFEKDPDLALSCHGVKYHSGSVASLERFAKDYTPSIKRLKDAHVLFRNVMITISIMIKKPENLEFDETKRRGSDMLFWLEIVLRGGKAIWIRDYMSFTAKPLYGAGGLSGNIWKAEMAQQDNLHKLWVRGYISLWYSLFLRAFSFAKMIRRYMIYIIRTLKGEDPSPQTINPPVRRLSLFGHFF